MDTTKVRRTRSKSPGRKLTDRYTSCRQIITRSYSRSMSSPDSADVSKGVLSETPTQISLPENTPSRISNIIITISLLLCLLLSIILGAVSWQNQQLLKCQKLNSMKIASTNLLNNISSSVTGHEPTVNMLIDHLNEFDGMRNNKLTVMWWTGPIGVGKSRVSKLLTNVESVAFHVYHDSLLPQDKEALETESLSLYSNLDKCAPNVIIIDGYDSEKSASFSFLNTFLYVVNNCQLSNQCLQSSKILVILIGSHHSQAITRAYLNHLSDGKTRLSFYEETEYLDELHNSISLFGTHDFTVVPFLPLEYNHLEDCVKTELKSVVPDVEPHSPTLSRVLGKSLKQIVDSVAKTTTFYPEESRLLLAKGCKRVSSHLKKELSLGFL